MSRSNNKHPSFSFTSLVSTVALLASIYPAAAAAAPGASGTTSTVRYTSTITMVQTIYPSTAAAAVTTETASTATNEPSYTDDGVFENVMLNISNTVRQDYNASSLVWNDTLAVYAQSWSERCTFEHSVRLHNLPVMHQANTEQRMAPTARISQQRIPLQQPP